MSAPAGRAIDAIGSPANFAGAGAAIIAGIGAAVLGAGPFFVVGAAVLAYLGGFLVGSPRKRELHVSMGGGGREDVAAAADSLRRQLAGDGTALPEDIRADSGAILDSIAELLPKWDAEMAGMPEQRQVIASILGDYLPTTLNAYLSLPRSYLNRGRSEALRETREQVGVLVSAVQGIQDAVFHGVEQRIRSQSQFLRDKFSQGGNLTL